LAAAYGVGLWTHAVHWRSGAREAHDVTFWAHWFRDSTLSVPLVLLAVLAATMCVGQRARALRTTGTIAASVAMALALGVPVHAGIFGHAAHHGVAPSLPVSMLAEFLIDLPAALLLSAAVLGFGAIAWPERPKLSARQRSALSLAALLRCRNRRDPDIAGQRSHAPSVCSAAAPHVRTT
jgi:hypothetical protein